MVIMRMSYGQEIDERKDKPSQVWPRTKSVLGEPESGLAHVILIVSLTSAPLRIISFDYDKEAVYLDIAVQKTNHHTPTGVRSVVEGNKKLLTKTFLSVPDDGSSHVFTTSKGSEVVIDPAVVNCPESCRGEAVES